MAQYLRVGLRPDRWLTYPEIPWLGPGELQADAIGDLRTKGNTLSVFEVDDPANLERIAVAVAAGLEDPGEVGYAVFGREEVEALGIQIQRNPGTTPDAAVNGLHHDLHNLTATQLVRLANVIAGGTIDAILPKRVRELIKEGVDAGQLDRAGVNKKLLARL